ncbi:MAG: undecaprenyl-diphosphate phosphatase [Candidatus Omnitrophica bacterium]|nr:undecaprenyl-diphosphate phosphatase [Candidatus Omnitrophota bacterium]
MDPLHAFLLGVVEGFTEFLPISSTGHLILVTHLLGLSGDAVKTFEVVIQAGALGAVAALYRDDLAAMWRGLLGRDAAGRRLFWNLILSFLPAAVIGVALHRLIKAHLFTIGPVAAALAAGGVLMLGVDQWSRRAKGPARGIESMTPRDALLIGLAQCLALWPGTSRAMATIVAGLLLGFPATVAAEYSFLLALPTLGAATLFDASLGGQALLQESGILSLASGFLGAAGVAALAIRGFIQYLTQRGLAPFGWYRLALALVVWWTLSGA